MEVIVAKTAGFCFGVKRAVESCYAQLELIRENEAGSGSEAGSAAGAGSGFEADSAAEAESKTVAGRAVKGPVYTYGPIIHNEQVVEDLERKGIRVIHSREELSSIRQGTVIIRSHGASRSICEQIEAQGLTLVDATCPFVRKIHRIVEEKSREGYRIVVIGKATHPEVEGICGWSASPVTVIETEEEAKMLNFDPRERVCVVSQTTFNSMKFDKLVEILQELRYDSFVILNTICNATEERQKEAAELADKADAMIVIGGKHSSNTQKLFEICKSRCDRTFYIQTLADLDIRLLPSMGCVGITAGASTPNNLIEEVSKQCLK